MAEGAGGWWEVTDRDPAGLSFREQYARARPELVAEIERERAVRPAPVPEESLDWMALAPVWTLGLARAAGFPNAGRIEETLAAARDEGWVQYAPPRAADFEDDEAPNPDLARCWMSREQRAAHLEKRIRERGRDFLQQTLRTVVAAVAGARERGAPLLDLMTRWLALAQEDHPSLIARRFFNEVEQRVGNRDPGEAARWVEAVQPLEQLFGGELSAAVLRALRSIEYADRRAADERYLKNFLRREEQQQSFEELLAGPDDQWALHYLGGGGSGKTMLMRYFHTVLLPERRGCAARLDFDHLNPTYPSKQPGLLLVQLAEELRLHDATGAAHELFGSLFERIQTLHEQLAIGGSGADPIDNPLFAFVQDLFAGAMRNLPQPVVLILDTCEELSKVEGGEVPRNVRDTFRILEGLHDRFPKLRVIFCGRRPLASTGAGGWEIEGRPHLERKYLRLHLMRGFSRQECEQYLAGFPVKRDLWDAILERSPDAGLAVRLKGPAKDSEPRYSPYLLFLHAQWAASTENLTREDILDDRVDQFVRIRILGRLTHRPELRGLIPAAALLGRFDEPTLRVAARSRSDNFPQLFRELADQEWAAWQEGGVVAIDPELRPRLVAHFIQEQPAQVEAARRAALDQLKRKTLGPPAQPLDLSRLSVQDFLTFIRLCEPFPSEAAEWWRGAELRLVETGNFEWIVELCRTLLSESGPLGPNAPSRWLRPAVQAAQAAALGRTLPPEVADWQLPPLWEDVLHDAATLRLRVRARLALATRDKDGPEALGRILHDLRPEWVDAQMAASFVAAIERIVERLENHPDAASLNPLRETIENLLPLASVPALRAFLLCLEARVELLSGEAGRARELFEAARGVRDLERHAWLDWQMPEDLLSRLNLEYVRGCYGYSASPALLLERLTQWAGSLESRGEWVATSGTADGDRMYSAVLGLAMALGPGLRGGWPSRSRSAVSNAHRAFPPSFAAHGKAVGELGRVTEAFDALHRFAREAEQSAAAFDLVLAADRVRVHLARRMRLLGTRWVPNPTLLLDMGDQRTGPEADSVERDRLLGCTWRALLDRNLSFPTERVTLRLACGFCYDPNSAETLLGRLKQDFRGDPETSRVAYVDALEMNAIARRYGLALPFPDLEIKPRAWLFDDRSEPGMGPLDLFALFERAAALQPGFLRKVRPTSPFVKRIGVRQAAEIARQTGELLALRLPECAVGPLERARSWFSKSGGESRQPVPILVDDPVGAFLAAANIALIWCRLGRPDRVKRALDEAQSAYERFRAGGAALPPWQRLSAAAREEPAEWAGAVDDQGWLPWLYRVATCIAWDADGGVPRQRVARVLDRFQEIQPELPPELYGWAAASEPAAAPELEQEPLAVSPERIREIEAKAIQKLQHPSGSRRLRVFLDQPELRLRIRLLEAKPSWWAQNAVEMQLERGDWRMPAEPVRDKVALTFEPYRTLRERMNAGIRDALAIASAEAASPHVVLDLDSWLAPVCWEAVVVSEPGGPAAMPVFRRRLPSTLRQPPFRGVALAAGFSGTLEEEQICAQALRTFPVNEGPFRLRYAKFGDLASGTPMDAQIAVIFGRPTRTSAGVRLERTGSLGAGWTSQARRGELLGSVEIQSNLRGLRICILVASPSTSPVRTDTDREKAVYLRMLAAELCVAGVPCVLTIPPLSGRVGAKTAEALVAAVAATDAPLTERLLEAVRSAQQMIVAESELPMDDRLEQACDLTCYALDDSQWPFTPQKGESTAAG